MIDKAKKYTSNGKPVRIIATDLKGNYQIVGIVEYDDGTEVIKYWAADGRYCNDGREYFKAFDLVEVVEPVTVWLGWVNVYDDMSFVHLHRTKRDADNAATASRIACKESFITYIPGDGLND